MKAGDRIVIKEGHPKAGLFGTVVELARGSNSGGLVNIYWENDKLYWIGQHEIEVVDD